MRVGWSIGIAKHSSWAASFALALDNWFRCAFNPTKKSCRVPQILTAALDSKVVLTQMKNPGEIKQRQFTRCFKAAGKHGKI